MDKSWMSKDRLTSEYIQGVERLISVGKEEGSFIRCPCRDCSNINELTKTEVRNHLFERGISQSYTIWRFHGESSRFSETPTSFTEQDTFGHYDEVETSEDVGHYDETETPEDVGYYDEIETPEDVERMREMAKAAEDHYTTDPEKFKELLEDAETPLYEGCSKFTKLSIVIILFNLKANSGWSDTSFSKLLKLLGQMLPQPNLLPKSLNGVKKTLSVYGMKYEKIHACPNDCILYRGDKYKDEIMCPICGVSRYKENKRVTNKSGGVPAKVLWYFPPIPRFKKMFQSAQTSKSMTWHADERVVDGKMRHLADSPAWKLVDEKYPEFAAESRNLRLALSADGVNPHRTLSTKYSLWPVMLVTYNLPPWLCMKRKYMMLTMLISGPNQPGNNIDVYLAPLVDDLHVLWEIGVDAYDVYRHESFILKAVLLWTINDLPAYSNLSGCTVKGYFACPICGEGTSSTRLKHSGKNVYTANRRFLPRYHPYRRQKKAFNGKTELREAPEPLTGLKVLEEVEGIKGIWGTKGTITGATNCFKKKSVFFELPYWRYLELRHNVDFMHTEKNVCDSIVGTLLNIPRKNKDTIKSRLDLQEMGLRTELAPTIGEKRSFLPPACHTLSRDEKKRLCKTLHELKVPSGYSSNFRPLVSMQDLKLQNMKSHDCHVLMQQLLPVAIRTILPKNVRCVIIRLCSFFKAICSKVIDKEKLPQIQEDIVLTVCLLEKYFPPSFFDVMIHLTVHLVREVDICGPVFYRWMYAFERYMTVLKGFIRNRNRPEACIAENYIAEEAIKFCSEFLPDLDAIEIPLRKDNTTTYLISSGNLPRGSTHSQVDRKTLDQAHLYVLQNTRDVQPYIEEHMNYLKEQQPRKSKKPTWLHAEHNRSFSDWLRDKVLLERGNPDNKVSNTLKWVSKGPLAHVYKYSTYVTNGYRFVTKRQDALRVNQNSGVSLTATTPQVSSAKDQNPIFSNMSFYGVIAEIWLLDYTNFKIPMFKCDWVDSKNAIRKDDMGFTLVDLGRVGYKSDSFILASQAEQVFYVPDQLDPTWSVVVESPQRCFYEYDDDNDDELVDAHVGDDNFVELPNVDSLDVNDESQSVYVREDCEGTWVEHKETS